jgi:hypothetical protein
MESIVWILLIFLLIGLFSLALSLLCLVRLFQKAQIPSWYALVPFLNVWHFMKMIQVPFYFVFFLMIPLVNLFIYIHIVFQLSKAFRQSTGFAFGLFFLPMIFYPILAFGSAQYAYLEDSRTWYGDLLDDDL